MRLRLPHLARLSYLTLATLLGVLLLTSSVFLLSQAVRTSPNRNWSKNINALIIGAAYVAVLVMSLAFCLKRRLSVRRSLSHIPMSRMAISKADVPKVVHQFIEEEFLRSCAIVHASQPKVAYRAGWGRPGTQYEGMRYRTAILDTVPVIDAAARSIIPSMPPLAPNAPLDKHLRHIKALLPANDPTSSLGPSFPTMAGFHSANAGVATPSSRVDAYAAAVHNARYSERELDENEFVGAMDTARWLLGILNAYKRVLQERHAS